MSSVGRFLKRKSVYLVLLGFLIAVIIVFSGSKALKYTSTDEFCNSCHTVHPHSTQSWKLSTHYANQRGIIVHCVDCHLPPEGLPKFTEKVKTGVRDVYGVLFKDVSKLNWEEKSRPENAVKHTYEASCIACHQNLFPIGLSTEGEDAHLHYSNNREDLHCINCHIAVGHYSETAIHAHNVDFGLAPAGPDTIYTKPSDVDSFEDYTEYIPGSGVKFEMLAIEGGRFMMGSPDDEPLRNQDEGPRREVEVSSFFIGKAEVSWDEYLAFFSQTGSQGRMSEAELAAVDGISGPTPPWGAPDQGWGKGSMPAMSMSFYAAEQYCKWLSEVTGKKYRLPTEAEWEYAARAGTESPYFFEGNPADFSGERFWNKLFKPDISKLNSYVIYRENSNGRTATPSIVGANPFGLLHPLGNVAEFCSDWYSPDAYINYPEGVVLNPRGPESGMERVVRGGSYRSDAKDFRCASRDYTRTQEWLRTDPQMPKSIWWYSDAFHVGIRVVCEFE
jgi:formylglycine-generating enzyme